MKREDVVRKTVEALGLELQGRFEDDSLLDRIEKALAELRADQVSQETVDLVWLIAEQADTASKNCLDPVLASITGDDKKFDQALSDHHSNTASELSKLWDQLNYHVPLQS